jgi:hypothetical protein
MIDHFARAKEMRRRAKNAKSHVRTANRKNLPIVTAYWLRITIF